MNRNSKKYGKSRKSEKNEQIICCLQKNNIKPSYARIKIYEYLTVKRNHPAVDMIYNELSAEIPTLSKTTVYNTLGLLADAGLVRAITIEDNETRYDAGMQDHGHFKCESCGRIFDFSFESDSLVYDGLADFEINTKNVYFNGICSGCRKVNKK